MKKIVFLLFLTVVLFSTCKKEDPVPDCEAQHYGEISITNSNNYIYDLYVNKTSYGKINAKSTKVVQHEPGSCTIKFIVEDGYWYQIVDLKQCDFLKVVFKF